MEVTEVRVTLLNPGQNHNARIKGFCSVVLDGELLVKDMKIVSRGRDIFVAMPNRKLTDHCPKCRCKNHLLAQFCNACGTALAEGRADVDASGQEVLYFDIIHPINPRLRNKIEKAVRIAYADERCRLKRTDEDDATRGRELCSPGLRRSA